MPLQVRLDATNVLDSYALLPHQVDHMLFAFVNSFIIFLTLVGRGARAKEEAKPASSHRWGKKWTTSSLY
jgi:hypothetical protein